MKKIIPIVCVLAAVLCACTQQNKTPAITSGITFDAVYETGDFRYNCTVKWKNGTAFITVNSTNAAGLTISCDGKSVTFSKGAMIKKMPRDEIDSTNPAALLWEIFTALENGATKCALGNFICEQKDGKIARIAVGDISITNVE